MNLEYTAVLVVALGGAVAIAAVGGSLENTIVGDSTSDVAHGPILSVQAGALSSTAKAASSSGVRETLGTLRELASGVEIGAADSRRFARAPLAVQEHFDAWLRNVADQPTGTYPARLEDAFDAAASHSLNAYFHATSLGVDKERGFAVAIPELEATLKSWGSVKSADSRSTKIRHAMDGNLRFMERKLDAVIDRYGEHVRLWNGAQRETEEELRSTVAVLETIREEVRGARKSKTLSKRQALTLADRYFDAEQAGLDVRPSDKIRPFRMSLTDRRLGGRELFPLFSETPRYWKYRFVPSWIATDVLPVEVPLAGKFYDGKWGTALAHAKHDYTHVINLGRIDSASVLAEDSGRGSRFSARILAERRALEARDPDFARDIDDVLGHLSWESFRVGDYLDHGVRGSDDARGLVADWLRKAADDTGRRNLSARQKRVLSSLRAN